MVSTSDNEAFQLDYDKTHLVNDHRMPEAELIERTGIVVQLKIISSVNGDAVLLPMQGSI